MGNVCCRDTISEIDDREERSRILVDDNNCENDYLNSNQDAISYGSFNNYGNSDNNGQINSNNSKSMEQSALDKIYQKMASNVIDVAPGETMVIQQAEFIERQKAYQAKLNQIKTSLPLKLASQANRLSAKQIGNTNSSNTTNNHTFDPMLKNNSPSSNSNIVTVHHYNGGNSSLLSGNINTGQQKAQLQDKRRVEYEPISDDDIQLINEISLKSEQAIKNLKISSSEQVITQFKP